jgi:DNA-binding MarR family transcriptional regulator
VRGLVTLRVGASDRRTLVVTPTARGRSTARRVLKHLEKLEATVGRHVTPADVTGFLKVVNALESEAAK